MNTAHSKLMNLDAAVALVKDGDTIICGGSSLVRKPMAAVRALARSAVRDLTVVAFLGGPEVDLLLAVGKVRKVSYAYVGFEAAGMAPHFRRAREARSIEAQEWSEYTLIAGLEAAARRLPFLPTRSGLGTDLLRVNPALVPFTSPIGAETLVAVPALKPDVAFIHVPTAHPSGYGVVPGDLVADDLIAKSAACTILTCDRLLSDEELEQAAGDALLQRWWVDGVVEVPWGAHPTACFPCYTADLEHLGIYQSAARDPQSFPQSYLVPYVLGAADQAAYLAALGGAETLTRLQPGGERR